MYEHEKRLAMSPSISESVICIHQIQFISVAAKRAEYNLKVAICIQITYPKQFGKSSNEKNIFLIRNKQKFLE